MFHRPKSDQQGNEQNTVADATASVNEPTVSPTNSEETNMNANTSEQQENTQGRIDIPGGSAAFQRPGAAAPQAGRVPPGSAYAAPAAAYPASGSYNTAGTVQNRVTAEEGRRLVIGEGISISGEIEACDTLVVEGTVEAALKGARILEVAENGTFYGTVEIDECTIAGRFEGDITVNGRLTIRSTGSITGTMAYKELAVESGAMVDGKITPLSAKGVAKADKPGKSHKAVARRDADNDASQLPFGNGIEAA
ncbi:MAG: polymer-forming cytoskeletal protein [Micavibrio sp.]